MTTLLRSRKGQWVTYKSGGGESPLELDPLLAFSEDFNVVVKNDTSRGNRRNDAHDVDIEIAGDADDVASLREAIDEGGFESYSEFRRRELGL